MLPSFCIFTHTPEIEIDTLPENQPLKINGWKEDEISFWEGNKNQGE